jgi:hypothetical protein
MKDTLSKINIKISALTYAENNSSVSFDRRRAKKLKGHYAVLLLLMQLKVITARHLSLSLLEPPKVKLGA